MEISLADTRKDYARIFLIRPPKFIMNLADAGNEDYKNFVERCGHVLEPMKISTKGDDTIHHENI